MALFGVSYDAGAAVRAAAHQHPAVKVLDVEGGSWKKLEPEMLRNPSKLAKLHTGIYYNLINLNEGD